MADNRKNILLLFDHPNDPIFMPRGDNNVVFDVPTVYLLDRYKDMVSEINNRVGENANEIVRVKDYGIPDLRIAMQLDRQDNFSIFLPKHKKIANSLIEIFTSAENYDQLLSFAAYAHDRVNAQLFSYALSVALVHREDTKDLDIPHFAERFPSRFVNSKSLSEVKDEVRIFNQGMRRPVNIPRLTTGSSADQESRLSYFREDVGANLHHWHWHFVYPVTAPDISIVRKDRRGELFYYMHQQLLARYDFERFSNDLSRVLPLDNLREPIPEGYYPKLTSLNASTSWPGRGNNIIVKDVYRPDDELDFKVNDVELWRERIINAVNEGILISSDNKKISLNDTKGIDVLGNTIEASMLTVNEELYGNYHIALHVLVGFQHDPKNEFMEGPSTAGDLGTALRDPVFYRIHKAVDNILNMHKETLTPYTEQFLTYTGIKVTGLELQSVNTKQKNIFNTFWQQSDVNLAKGLDFMKSGDVYVRLTHLQHSSFTINIQVNNESKQLKLGMVRIFMAPKYDEYGAPYDFNEQRRLMVELDKFDVTLNPGENLIKRRSVETNVTIPFEQTFVDLNKKPEQEGKDLENFNFCACGWPHHLLIPKGTTQGLAAALFVMVSDFEQDRVDQMIKAGSCNNAASYCGVQDKLYPDKKPMGYPFDRLGRQGVDNLAQYLTPNMRTQDVRIIFEDVVRDPCRI